MANLTEVDLYNKADDLCERSWGIKYTGKIELVDRKWKSKRGSFITKCVYPEGSSQFREVDPLIRMSRVVNNEMSVIEVVGVLHHELIHWWLWLQGKPNGDTDMEFVGECIRLGVPLSGTKSAKKSEELYRKGEESE